jgi:dynamin 1-like protein
LTIPLDQSFEILAKRQIALLEAPGLQCVEMVFDELRRLASTCMPADLERFAPLRERVTEVVHDILRGSLQKTQDMVSFFYLPLHFTRILLTV